MKDMSFEKALEKLENIVGELEKGDIPLDATLKKYEEGVALARMCQKKLDSARQKIELLVKGEDGEFVKKDFEGDHDED
ncbi:MAG: exodeoxyribonuclease VII small subunit [Candidatus Omnitrophica bacterium]|nr:exodeoxyribonuclease VII small subunit [Candidatus Omnitrophota bacterium]